MALTHFIQTIDFSVSQTCGFMDLINYEIWTAYQKVDLKVKAETLSSFHQNRLYLYFLSYFIAEVKYAAKTYLLIGFFTERDNFLKSNQCPSKRYLKEINYFFLHLNNTIMLNPKCQMRKYFHRILQMLTNFTIFFGSSVIQLFLGIAFNFSMENKNYGKQIKLYS